MCAYLVAGFFTFIMFVFNATEARAAEAQLVKPSTSASLLAQTQTQVQTQMWSLTQNQIRVAQALTPTQTQVPTSMPTQVPSQEQELEQESIKIPSRRALWLAYILRDKPEDTRIPDLEVVGDKTPVYLVPQGNSFRPLVKLTFRYDKSKGDLFINKNEPIRELNTNGEYVVYAYLQSRISTITLSARQKNGSTKAETFYLFAPEAREYKTSSLLNSISFSLGHSFLVYRQSSFGTFVSQSLLVGARYLSPETGRRLGLYGDAYLSVYTYASSPIESSPQFFEGRFGGSYSLKLTSKPKERSRLNLGVSTVNVYSFSSPFGFSGLFGPELGFRSEYYQNAKNSYALEFSLTPYEWGELLDERSVKLTGYLNRNLNSLRRMQLGLSYSSHKFSADTEEINIDLLSVFFSLSF